MLSEKPAISEFVVALNQLDTVAFRQAQLVGAAGYEIICKASTSVVRFSRAAEWIRGKCDLRMTSKMSPGSGLVELGVAIVAVQAAAQSLRGDVEGRIEMTDEAARRPTLHLWVAGFRSEGRTSAGEGFAADWDGKRNKRGPGSTVWRRRRSARGFDAVN